MTFQDEPLEDVLPDESTVQPAQRGFWDRLRDRFSNPDGDVGADDDDEPEEVSQWQ